MIRIKKCYTSSKYLTKERLSRSKRLLVNVYVYVIKRPVLPQGGYSQAIGLTTFDVG